MGSPYFARWAPYGLSVALFRPLGSIRALAPAMCSLRCAHTPTQPPYFAIAPYGLSVALFRPLGSIRALCRPISPVGLNTGSGSGYVLTALRAYAYATALFRYRSIRALCRPISPVGLNTGSCHPGVALRLPRAVFWRPFRALSSPSPNQQCPHRGRPFPLAESTTPAPRARSSPSPNQQCPHRGRPFPLAKSTTPAPRASIPPHQINNARTAGALFPLAESTTPAPRASIPPRKINNARTAGVHSPSPNQQHPRRGRPFPLAESTTPAPRASIPPRHLRRGGGRQAGGEVRKLYPRSLSTLSIAQSWAFFLS